jgi:hypothetical protein
MEHLYFKYLIFINPFKWPYEVDNTIPIVQMKKRENWGTERLRSLFQTKVSW